MIPYTPPASGASPAEQRAALTAFLRSVDVLWADFYPGTFPALRLRHELNLPCRAVLFGGGTLPKGAEAMLFPWQGLLRPDDALIFSCTADRKIWRRLVSQSVLREWVVACPVDETVFRPQARTDRLAIRRRNDLPLQSPLLLYVGRLNIQKNLHGLFRLLAAVRREVQDVHLCLVGEEDDIRLAEFEACNTGYVAWLRILAAELGVADAVTFLGPLFGEDLADMYRAADVVTNLSFYHRENFGLSQAEAQACGTPVVCSDWGGFKDVVRHGKTGYLVDAMLTKRGVRVDWKTGAHYTTRLLREPNLRAEVGVRAAAWARQQFAIPALAPRLRGVVVGRRPPANKGQPNPDDTVTYEPSAFAHQYKEHKRACGWYADTATSDAAPERWYPRMFEGRDYALYETLMRPYATRLVSELPPSALRPSWIPYIPSGVDLDPIRQVARDLDPVWPRQRYLRPMEWEALRRIDGTASVGDIVDALARSPSWGEPSAIIAALCHLWVDGLVLFYHPARRWTEDGLAGEA